MTRVVFWKEVREHGPAALAVLLLACGTAALAAYWPTLDSSTRVETGRDYAAAFLLLGAIAAGIVNGAALLAAEHESGTQSFLDTLPATRLRLWLAKAGTGLAMTAAQWVVLAVVALVLTSEWRSFPGPEGAHALLLVVLLGLVAWGLGAGLLGSAHAKTSLGAAALAVVYWLTLAVVWWLFVAIIVGGLRLVGGPPEGAGAALAAVALAVLAVVPAGLSAWHYARHDLRRNTDPTMTEAGPLGAGLWLAWRQGGPLVLGGVAVSLALGVAAAWEPLGVWAATTLGLGVLAGVAVLAGEQGPGVGRFYGDRRAPLSRWWAAKAGYWLVTAAGCALVALVIGFLPVVYIAEVYRGGNNGGNVEWAKTARSSIDIAAAAGVFNTLSFWLLHGFAAGHLAGLLFRKPVVALFAGAGGAMLLSAAWLPSLVAGGVALWQWLPVPVLLVALTRLLLRPWANERLTARGPLLTAAGVLALVPLWVAGNLAYRAVEVPEAGVQGRVDEFIAGARAETDREAGRLVRRAGELLENRPGAAQAADAGDPNYANRELGYLEELNRVRREGWVNVSEATAKRLRDECRGEWLDLLKQAAPLPTGVFTDARHLDIGSHLRGVQGPRQAANILPPRALQLQAEGKPAEALELFEATLSAARNVGNRSVLIAHLVQVAIETVTLETTLRFAERSKNPAELARLCAALARHERERPPVADALLGDHLTVLNSLNRHPTLNFNDNTAPSPGSLNDALTRLPGAVPWEAQRYERLAAQLLAGGLEQAAVPFDRWDEVQKHSRYRRLTTFAMDNGAWGRFFRAFGTYNWLTPPKIASWDVRRHTTRVALALHWHHADTGKAADTLDQLVPRYLDKLPADPYGGKPLLYRVSKGEKVRIHTEGTPPVPGGVAVPEADFRVVEVPAGTGVLYSVGPDLVDEGGEFGYAVRDLNGDTADSGRVAPRGSDWVVVVAR